MVVLQQLRSNAHTLPAVEAKVPIAPLFAPNFCMAPLSFRDEDKFHAYQQRGRASSLMRGLLAPLAPQLAAKVGARGFLRVFLRRANDVCPPRHTQPHRFSLHTFTAFGIVETRTASESLVYLLQSYGVLTFERTLGNINNLGRAMSRANMSNAQRGRAWALVNTFAEESLRVRELQRRLRACEAGIRFRQKFLVENGFDAADDGDMLQLQVARQALLVNIQSKPSDRRPPPNYSAEAPPPGYMP